MSNESVESHVYHHTVKEDLPPTINLKVEKNSRGVNIEVTIMGARDPEEAASLVKEVLEKAKKEAEALQSEVA